MIVAANTVTGGLSDVVFIILILCALALGAGACWLFLHMRKKRARASSEVSPTEHPDPADVNLTLEQLEEARRAFTANVSHELKTPLTVISGYAELLKAGMVNPQDITEVSAVILEEAKYMLSLVNDVLTLAQLDEFTATGNTKAHLTEVDLTVVVTEVFEQLKPFATHNEVICEIDTSGNTRILAIKRLLTSIVYNLCENAIRYNKPGGSVQVVIEGLSETVRLVVIDSGHGIPLEEQPRVFERFYRIDAAHSRESGGTGLGLAIVKHGALYHNATLTLESEPAKGTKVTVEFPR